MAARTAYNLLNNFPNCPNFKLWEAFVTTRKDWKGRRGGEFSGIPSIAGSNFSPALFAEFINLPESEQSKIMANLIQLFASLQVARDVLDFPFKAASVWRSRSLNAAVGSKTETHVLGLGYDPDLQGVQLDKFLKFFEQGTGGVGRGASQGHIDIIRTPANRRWAY
jgi:hypothetical protein